MISSFLIYVWQSFRNQENIENRRKYNIFLSNTKLSLLIYTYHNGQIIFKAYQCVVYKTDTVRLGNELLNQQRKKRRRKKTLGSAP